MGEGAWAWAQPASGESCSCKCWLCRAQQQGAGPSGGQLAQLLYRQVPGWSPGPRLSWRLPRTLPFHSGSHGTGACLLEASGAVRDERTLGCGTLRGGPLTHPPGEGIRPVLSCPSTAPLGHRGTAMVQQPMFLPSPQPAGALSHSHITSPGERYLMRTMPAGPASARLTPNRRIQTQRQAPASRDHAPGSWCHPYVSHETQAKLTPTPGGIISASSSRWCLAAGARAWLQECPTQPWQQSRAEPGPAAPSAGSPAPQRGLQGRAGDRGGTVEPWLVLRGHT